MNNIKLKNIDVKFRIVAETLVPAPSKFTIEELTTNKKFYLTAIQIFKLNYICNFSAQDIITTTYCYAEEQFPKYKTAIDI